MFIDKYAGDLVIRKSCNFDRSLSLKSHMIRMLELQLSQFFTDPLYET